MLAEDGRVLAFNFWGTGLCFSGAVSICIIVRKVSIRSRSAEVMDDTAADAGVVIIGDGRDDGGRAMGDEGLVGERVQRLARPAAHQQRHGVPQVEARLPRLVGLRGRGGSLGGAGELLAEAADERSLRLGVSVVL